jgi:hypothetical protein
MSLSESFRHRHPSIVLEEDLPFVLVLDNDDVVAAKILIETMDIDVNEDVLVYGDNFTVFNALVWNTSCVSTRGVNEDQDDDGDEEEEDEDGDDDDEIMLIASFNDNEEMVGAIVSVQHHNASHHQTTTSTAADDQAVIAPCSMMPYILNEVGLDLHDIGKFLQSDLIPYSKAREMVLNSSAVNMLSPTEMVVSLLLSQITFYDQDNIFALIPLPETRLTLAHYQLIFESSTGLKESIHEITSHFHHSKYYLTIEQQQQFEVQFPLKWTINAMLFIQADANGFEIVQYLIEHVGLNPNVGWPSSDPMSNLVFNQMSLEKVCYFLNKAHTPVTEDFILHYICSNTAYPSEELLPLLRVLAHQSRIDLASIRSLDKGNTLLHLCCFHRPNLNLIKGLIEEFGVNGQCLNADHQTSLMMIDWNHVHTKLKPTELMELLKFLIDEVRIDINAKDSQGRTVLKLWKQTHVYSSFVKELLMNDFGAMI